MYRTYFLKWRATERAPARATNSRVAWAAIGAFAGIMALVGIADATGASLLMAPFGATAALAGGAPGAPGRNTLTIETPGGGAWGEA